MASVCFPLATVEEAAFTASALASVCGLLRPSARKAAAERGVVGLLLSLLMRAEIAVGRRWPDGKRPAMGWLSEVGVSVDLPVGEVARGEYGDELCLMLRAEAIRCLSMLLHANPWACDLVRAYGAVPLLLAQVALDERDPTIREWATLAVRSLTFRNPENQAVIDRIAPNVQVADGKITMASPVQRINAD